MVTEPNQPIKQERDMNVSYQIVDSKTNSLVMECPTRERAEEELKLFFADGKKHYIIVEHIR